ncbi:hypothetical protein AB834_05195 [PVC group bacterium (ex Bugula neritina AB1)]|nr:hypothetical protein AB834_05195 [PVC group bacterium (ex Bugula neritina AB1)]
MVIDLCLPEIGEGVTEADVASLLVKVGDIVEEGQTLIELETNKATVDFPSEVSGVVKDILVKEGQTVSIGAVLIKIEESGASENPDNSKEESDSLNTPDVSEVASSGGEKDLLLPEIGEGVTSAEIARILVQEGDSIDKDQLLMEIETQKATVDFPADCSGIIQKILVKEGDSVSIGDKLLVVQEKSGSSKKDIATSVKDAKVEKTEAAINPSFQRSRNTGVKADPSRRIPASPSLRRRARVLDIDLYDVPGTGPGGRITIEDFDRFLLAQNSSDSSLKAPSLPDFSQWGKITEEPYKSLRKKTAEHVSMSARLIPHVTQFDEADVTELELLRKEKGQEIKKKGGKLTPIVLLLKAVAHALKKFPQFATSLDEKKGKIVYKDYCHIGIAVDTPKGLMVPVIQDVDKKSLEELALELVDIGERARLGKIKLSELQGGVFTISSLGHLGGTYFTPIINYPEVAILGVSRQEYKPVVRQGEIVSRLILPYALSYDHRVIDGVAAVKFTRELAEYLQTNGPFSSLN